MHLDFIEEDKGGMPMDGKYYRNFDSALRWKRNDEEGEGWEVYVAP